jgi:hypothetical protein
MFQKLIIVAAWASIAAIAYATLTHIGFRVFDILQAIAASDATKDEDIRSF